MTTEIMTDEQVECIKYWAQGNSRDALCNLVMMEQAAQLNRIATVLEKIERRMSADHAVLGMDSGPM